MFITIVVGFGLTVFIIKKINHTQTPKQATSFWNGDLNSLSLANDAINVVYRFEKNGEGYY